MSETKWNIVLRVYRQKEGGRPHYDEFELEVDPDEYVLDAVERVWAYKDRTLCFRHACHHSTCGACGMLVNGVEKLTCITYIRDVTQDGAKLTIDPLRNFPVISDLTVDMGNLYSRMEDAGARSVLPVSEAEIEKPAAAWSAEDSQYIRLTDCIECGLCISACPSAATSSNYLGPAVLAAVQANGFKQNPNMINLVDNQDGVWRCHSAFECTEVCPSFVDPARRIMDLRTQIFRQRVGSLFRKV
jgi:succinate dehydrogenase / fumarate reductase iron-sulfur subunit